MRLVFNILEEIAAAKGTKAKKDVISNYKDDPIFREVVKYALDQNKSYDLVTLPDSPRVTAGTPEDIFSVLDKLADKRGTTETEAMELANLCGTQSTREVVTRILRKDLRCGARAKVFNGVKKGWVYQVPYQRYKSSATINKIDFSDHVVCQLKMDGMFAYFFTGDNDTPFLSRNGSKFSLGKEFQSRIKESWIQSVNDLIGEPTVRMGELLILGEDGKFLPRKEGNGIINSFISGKGDLSKVDRIRYVTWGWVTQEEFHKRESDTPYIRILEIDQKKFQKASPCDVVVLSKSKRVRSLEQAQDFFSAARKRKEEGAMVKMVNKLKWKDQQSGTPFGVKLKAEFEAEFEIVGAYPGEAGKKYAEMLGGIRVRSSCGLIESNLGSGFSDEERARGVDWWNNRKGMIVSAKFTGLITDKTDRETWCFDHGRFSETRFNEKTEADSYKEVLEMMEGN